MTPPNIPSQEGWRVSDSGRVSAGVGPARTPCRKMRGVPLSEGDKVASGTAQIRTVCQVSSDYFSIVTKSNETPGPIVELIQMLRTYFPFAAAGLAFTTESISVRAFSTNFSALKDALPTGV